MGAFLVKVETLVLLSQLFLACNCAVSEDHDRLVRILHMVNRLSSALHGMRLMKSDHSSVPPKVEFR